MPIKGLTTQAPQFPLMGKLRKGSPKPEKGVGPDLDYFRYTSNTHPESVRVFNQLYSKPQSLTVLLPYSTVDENFEAWQEHWSASRLQHRCDGEYIHMLYDHQNKRYVRPQQPTPCTGGCKQVGRLQLIIPELLKAGHVGVITLETHSKWDISDIHGALSYYYSLRGSLQGIEFVLYRYQREISTPSHGRKSKWLVGIKPNHEWVVAQFGAMQQAALTTPSNLQIEAGEHIDHDTGEIIDGSFEYSGAADVSTIDLAPDGSSGDDPAREPVEYKTAGSLYADPDVMPLYKSAEHMMNAINNRLSESGKPEWSQSTGVTEATYKKTKAWLIERKAEQPEPAAPDYEGDVLSTY